VAVDWGGERMGVGVQCGKQSRIGCGAPVCVRLHAWADSVAVWLRPLLGNNTN
jgi:hypothetical protein